MTEITIESPYLKVNSFTSGFALGDIAVTEYNSACPRSVLLHTRGIRKQIDPIYAETGEFDENRYESEIIKSDGRIYNYTRELKLTSPISDKVSYSGRADFVCDTHKVGTVVHEKKSTFSKSARTQLRKGKAKLNHIAQLSGYLDELKSQRGKVFYSYYEKDENGVLTAKEDFDIKVVVTDKGHLIQNGEYFEYTMFDYLAHRKIMADVIEHGEVYKYRPLDWDSKFKSPCKYCPFSKACDNYDSSDKSTVGQFYNDAKKCIEESQ